jgi:hypothetical protein
VLEVFLFKTIQIGYPTRSDRNPQRASDPLYNQYKVSEKQVIYIGYMKPSRSSLFQRAIGMPIAFFNSNKKKYLTFVIN